MPQPLDYGDRVDGPGGAGPAASLQPPSDRDGRLHPRNPWVGLFLAVVLLVCAVTGLAAVALEPSIVFASSNRRAGITLIAPLVAAVAGAVTLVRGFLAIGPWLAHRAATPLALRRQERAADLHGQRVLPLVLFGVPALAGAVVLTVIFTQYRPGQIDLVGRMLQVEIVGFLLLLATATLGLLAQKLYHRRFYVGRDPRRDLPQ